VLYGKIREFLIPIFKELAFQKGCKIIKGNMVQDHVHMFIEIPQSILFPKLLGTSRAKALLPLRDNLVGVSGILMGSNFEPGATQYRQLALNWLRYMNTLKIKNG
jgi:putative transposase